MLLRRMMPLALAISSACAGHTMPKPAGLAGTPRVGWVIMYGSPDNPDQEFVCQSNPRSDCEIPASRPNRQVFSDVHFYFHPAQAETRYTGRIQIGFFTGNDSAQQLTPADTVKPGNSAANHSVVGIVTDKPGTHTLTLAVNATSAGGEQQIREQIPVVVK